MTPPAILRDATLSDLPAIEAIYTPYVLGSDCTLQLEPTSPTERRAWFEALRAEGLPVRVAACAGEVVGFGALVRFNLRAGYRFTVEDSLYLRADACGRGLGKQLLDDLLARAEGLGMHTCIAKITARQEQSLRLHRSRGFVEVGRLAEVGFKLGGWVDVVMLQRRLG